MFTRQGELDQPEQHAHTRRGESVMPVLRGQPAAGQGSQERAQVDTHVVDGKAAVPPWIAGGIEFADHCADIRLEQPGAERDQDQPQEKRRNPWNGERKVTAHDDDAAIPDRALGTHQAVGHPTARQGQQIDRGGIQPVDRGGGLVGQPHPAVLDGRDHEQHQQCPHAVVAEALPHFRHEERKQAARVSDPRDFRLHGQRGRSGRLS